MVSFFWYNELQECNQNSLFLHPWLPTFCTLKISKNRHFSLSTRHWFYIFSRKLAVFQSGINPYVKRLQATFLEVVRIRRQHCDHIKALYHLVWCFLYYVVEMTIRPAFKLCLNQVRLASKAERCSHIRGCEVLRATKLRCFLSTDHLWLKRTAVIIRTCFAEPCYSVVVMCSVLVIFVLYQKSRSVEWLFLRFIIVHPLFTAMQILNGDG